MTKKTTKIRAVGYIRVSTADQTKGESLEVQEAAVRAYAASAGMDLVTVLSDKGISGKNFKTRPGYLKMVAMAQAGEIDTIIAAKIDRLGRSNYDLVCFIHKMENELDPPVIVHGLDAGGDPTTTSGKLLRGFLIQLAEIEHEKIRDRTQEAKAARSARGITTQVCPGYGFTWVAGDPKTGVGRGFQIHPEQWPIIEDMVRWQEEGLSLTAIANRLNGQGVPTQSGKARWQQGTIRGVLGNPLLFGKYYEDRFDYTQTKTDADGQPVKVKTKRLKPRSQWREMDLDLLPVPVLTMAAWDRLQKRLAARSFIRNKVNRKADPFLGRGLLYCGRCGTKMASHTPSTAIRYYACGHTRLTEKQARNIGIEKCPGRYFSAPLAEGALWAYAKQIVLTPSVLLEALASPAKAKADLVKAEKALAQAQGYLGRVTKKRKALAAKILLAEDLEIGDEAKDLLASLKADLEAAALAVDDLEIRASGLREVVTGAKAWKKAAKDLKAITSDLGEALEDLAEGDRAELIRIVAGGARYVMTQATGWRHEAEAMMEIQAKGADWSAFLKTIEGKGAALGHLFFPFPRQKKHGATGRRETVKGWKIELSGQLNWAKVLRDLQEFLTSRGLVVAGESSSSFSRLDNCLFDVPRDLLSTVVMDAIG